jgi:hypothetical protein
MIEISEAGDQLAIANQTYTYLFHTNNDRYGDV